ncbi:hypothetical protein [Methylobacterium bullatum]|uniref:Uncharacterized protein n=1 Tax=Methylobacterium bullatum TaxID=570505 RepID=A0A679K4R7_9HYPH|nr:hypothetical protein MBLL_03519 [Methylobacterium bullatum]
MPGGGIAQGASRTPVEAMLALPTTTLGTPVLHIPSTTSAPPRPGAEASHAFLRSTMPALDRAFGLDCAADLPEDMAQLIARLHAGPLGAPSQDTASESTGLSATAYEPA